MSSDFAGLGGNSHSSSHPPFRGLILRTASQGCLRKRTATQFAVQGAGWRSGSLRRQGGTGQPHGDAWSVKGEASSVSTVARAGLWISRS